MVTVSSVKPRALGSEELGHSREVCEGQGQLSCRVGDMGWRGRGNGPGFICMPGLLGCLRSAVASILKWRWIQHCYPSWVTSRQQVCLWQCRYQELTLTPAEGEGALRGHRSIYLEDKSASVHPACWAPAEEITARWSVELMGHEEHVWCLQPKMGESPARA